MPHPVPQASAGRQHVQSLPAEDHHLVVVGESFEHPLGHALQLAFLHKVQAPLRVDVGEHLLDERAAGCPGRSGRCAAGALGSGRSARAVASAWLLELATAVLHSVCAGGETSLCFDLLQGVLAGSEGTSPGRRLIDGLDLPLRHLAFGVPDEQGDAHETAVNLLVEPDESFPVHPRPIPRCHACHGLADQQQIQRLPAQQGQLEAVDSPVAHADDYALGPLLLEAMLRVDVVEHLHDHLARQGEQAPQRQEAQLPARRARELQGLRAQLSLRHGCLSWQWLAASTCLPPVPPVPLRSLRSLRSLPFFLPLSVRVGCLLRARRWRDALRTQRRRGRSRAARHAARRRRAGPGSLRGGLLDFEFWGSLRHGLKSQTAAGSHFLAHSYHSL